MRSLLLAGEPVGLLAIQAEQAVGWCACGARRRYPQYDDRAQDTKRWAIPCLYIHPEADRGRVAKALIEAVVTLAQQQNAAAIEGPPPWWLPGDADARTLATNSFLANGFVRTGAGARMPELRLLLSDA